MLVPAGGAGAVADVAMVPIGHPPLIEAVALVELEEDGWSDDDTLVRETTLVECADEIYTDEEPVATPMMVGGDNCAEETEEEIFESTSAVLDV